MLMEHEYKSAQRENTHPSIICCPRDMLQLITLNRYKYFIHASGRTFLVAE